MKTAGLDFIEAVHAAHKGKKIRRAFWANDAYACYEGDKLLYISPYYREPLHVGYENISNTRNIQTLIASYSRLNS